MVEHALIYRDPDGQDRPTTPAALGLEHGDDPGGAALKAAQERTLEALWNAGYPAARIVGRRVETIGNGEGRARALFEFETGPRARFGRLEVDGAQKVRTSFLEKLATWEEGSPFDRSEIVAYRDRLVATSLFSSVDVAPGPPAADGASPVLVTVEERKRRTIGAGASFSTVEGPGGRLFFEYRNMFGAGERARAEFSATQIAQGLTLDFEKPLPRFPGSAYGQFALVNETTDAFDARTVALSAGLARRWLDDRLETRAGLALDTTKIRTETTEERTYFLSAPLSAVWNTEADPLALDQGERASLTIAPNTGSDTFLQMEFNARTRTNFGPEDRFTVAGRMRLGALFGSSLAELPINRRFFSGGGPSVRGYDFQAVGPLDAENRPIGGRSVIEGAIEARAVVAGPFQAAAFLDAGSVSESSSPDFGGDFLMGAGAGMRYLSPIGPLRVDFALPLERRSSDRAWQLYISLGQPF